MANSLAELEVLGLERLGHVGLAGAGRVREVRRLLLLLRRRGRRRRRRARRQPVQHLPDVEFPHGRAVGRAVGRSGSVRVRRDRSAVSRDRDRSGLSVRVSLSVRRSGSQSEQRRAGQAGRQAGDRARKGSRRRAQAQALD